MPNLVVKILLSSVIPITGISEGTSQCRRQLTAWLEARVVLTRKGLLYHLKLASIASQHGVVSVAQHFLRKLEEQNDMVNVFQCI